MEKLLDHVFARMAAALIVVLMLAALMVPTSVMAEGEMGLDTGHARGRVGDPLDTNDAGGDDDSDDQIQDTAGKADSGSRIFDRILSSSQVLLVPQYNGNTITFKLIILSDALQFVEMRYAK